MEAYERWLEKDGRHVELAVLLLIGLFDRPATPDCLAALRSTHIEGLTDTLALLTDAQWNLAIKRLAKLGLLEEVSWERCQMLGYTEDIAKQAIEADAKEIPFDLGEPEPFFLSIPNSVITALDAHPLIREYFGRRLRETAESAWRAAHSQLFETLRDSSPYWPEGLNGL